MTQVDLLACGWCRHPECVIMRGGSWRPVRLPSGVAVIRHPILGLGLFDTGYSQRFLDATRPFPERGYRWITPPECPPQATAAAQLAARGIAPRAVDWILLSHLHADHVAGLIDFPRARILVHADALAALRRRGRWANLLHGVLPSLLPDDLNARTRLLAPAEFTAIGPGGLPALDLAGDGSALVVPLPGHAAGQVGLLMQPRDAKPMFLVADAAWTSQAISGYRPPSWLAGLISEDRGTGARTLRLLHDLSLARPDLRLVPSHCATAFPGG
jgi:glyoxylase-like metal-dependent hydrolase (beta-lactamase superfamily II)